MWLYAGGDTFLGTPAMAEKAFVIVDQKTGIIMGALNFTQTLHDSKTIPDVLEQYQRLNGREAKEVFVDRECKGIKQYKAYTR